MEVLSFFQQTHEAGQSASHPQSGNPIAVARTGLEP